MARGVLLALAIGALALALACGKYGRPERSVVQPRTATAAAVVTETGAASDSAKESDRSSETAAKPRKP